MFPVWRNAHNLLRNHGSGQPFTERVEEKWEPVFRPRPAPTGNLETSMPNPSKDRPKSPEVENEDLKPKTPGPPRPATEPDGAEGSVKTSKTATDPGSGEEQRPPAPKTPAPKGWP